MAVPQDPLADLRSLEVGASATTADPAPAAPLQVNAHVHLPPNFSAFASVEQAVALAAAQDVRVLGASNYYHYGVYGLFASAARAQGVFPLFGLEVICRLENLATAGIKINDPGNPGKMYLCGKGITAFDPLNDEAARLLATIRAGDSARMATMVGRMGAIFEEQGVPAGVSVATIQEAIRRRAGVPAGWVYLQERHIAQAFQEAVFDRLDPTGRADALGRVYGTPPHADPGDAVAVQNEIRSRLMKAGQRGYVAETFVDFDHAYRLTRALGGIPCYPILADGAVPLCGFEDPVERLIAFLQEHEIPCAELIPNRNTPAVLERYVHALHAAGIVVLGGTEHNTLDLLPMRPHCAGGVPVPPWIEALFWEGACVVAAHQYLTARGQPGFVSDEEGTRARSPGTVDRTSDFARLGATVIQTFRRADQGA
jgi:hypothetical protein